MASRNPSLARRLILGLVAFQALIGLLAILSEPLISSSLPLRSWLATERAGQLIAASISRDDAGSLVFSASPELSAYMAEVPEFWFLGTDGRTFVRGGRQRAPINRFIMAMVPEEDWGTTLDLNTRGGRVGVLLGGQRSDLADGAWAWLSDRLRRWLLVLAAGAACTTVLTVGLVRLLLRPVHGAAQAARQLQPGRVGPALPEAAVPEELLPLVRATNDAFSRLEHEHEQQRRLHEQQRRFIANAAHELRTPIAILSIRMEELQESVTKQRLRQDVDRLAMLANQLLDLERLQQAEAAKFRPVDLVALAHDAVAEMGPLAIERGSNLSFQTARRCWEVAGDEMALRGVFLNLLGNALAHGGAGVQVALNIGADDTIEVADHGIGVPAEAQERVFEAFQRAGGGTGTGLGLYIVREVLAAHGARIELRDGRPGAVFRIRF